MSGTDADIRNPEPQLWAANGLHVLSVSRANGIQNHGQWSFAMKCSKASVQLEYHCIMRRAKDGRPVGGWNRQ